jgi:hypothetical protein
LQFRLDKRYSRVEIGGNGGGRRDLHPSPMKPKPVRPEPLGRIGPRVPAGRKHTGSLWSSDPAKRSGAVRTNLDGNASTDG